MADKDIFGVAETGTYSTSAPNPHVNLAGSSPTGYSIVQLFSGAMANAETATVTIRKDASNWAVYSGATYTTGSPNIVDLSTGSLLESAGSIANADTVDVLGLAPLATRHNDTAGLQGGSATERYHLTAAQATTATSVATTSAVGLAPQATAPASGLLSVLGIANGETVRTDKSIYAGGLLQVKIVTTAPAVGDQVTGTLYVVVPS